MKLSTFVLEAFDDIDRDWLLNTDKLDFAGKYVLIDFWAYSCINCVRTIPAIKGIHESVSRDDLVVVGVHTPEFDFEKEASNVVRAIEKLGITYPVVLDQEFYLWAYFNNQYWPAHYLFDPDGELVMESVGEEGTNEVVDALEHALGRHIPRAETPKMSEAVATPELYLGKTRGELGNSPLCKDGSCDVYSIPEQTESGKVYLDGHWEQHGQYVEATGDQSRLQIKFEGSEASGVLSSEAEASVECVYGEKVSSIRVNGPDTYRICNGISEGKNLVLKAPKGLRVYTLTFA